MDAMHREFFAFLNRFPYDLLIDLIERKLAEAGVTLKRRQRAALCRDLERQDWSDLKLCFGWELRNRKVVLNFTDVDLSEIEKKFNHVLETLPEIIASQQKPNSLTNLSLFACSGRSGLYVMDVWGQPAFVLSRRRGAPGGR